VSIQVPLEVTSSVKDATATIRKKIPGKHPNFVLYSSLQKLVENKKLAEYAEVVESMVSSTRWELPKLPEIILSS
jgi:guanylate kinase